VAFITPYPQALNTTVAFVSRNFHLFGFDSFGAFGNFD
jgi:hypothetical protein